MKRHPFAGALAVVVTIVALMGCAQTRSSSENPGDEQDENATGSVTALERDDMQENALSVVDMFEGRVAGLQVVRTASGPRFRIRGPNSFQGSSDALIVLDGSPLGTDGSLLSHLHPDDIQRVEVLKGASASIYGSRGANGVVVITTRR